MCSDALMGARIKTIFDDEHGLYGAKRIAASLNDDTDFPPINHKKVARIMKSMGLKGFTKRRRCVTTRRKPGHRVMPAALGKAYESDLEEIEGGETEGSPATVDRDVEAFSTTLLPTEGKGHSAESTTFFTTPLLKASAW